MIATIGIDNLVQGFQLNDGTIVEVNLIDTSGQERFNSIVSSYYKRADCCLLVYDITNKNSFKKIKEYYIEQLKEYNKNIRKIILLGNKTDLEDERKVGKEEGLALAEENKFIFMETSCVSNMNVSSAFETLIEMTTRDLLINNMGHIKSKKINNRRACC